MNFDFLKKSPLYKGGSELWKSISGSVEPHSQLLPEQIDAIKKILQEGGGLQGNELYQGGSDYLKKLMGGDFSAFEAPLMDKFNEEVVPGIAERFAGVGAMSSSGLNQALAQASKGLMTQLGAQRAGLMASMVPQSLSYAQQPISNMLTAAGQQTQPSYIEQKQGMGGDIGEVMKLVMMLAPMLI